GAPRWLGSQIGKQRGRKVIVIFKMLCACLCALAISSSGLAQQPKPTKAEQDAQVEKEIRQLENDIFAAIQHKDAKKLDVILADDFVYRSPQEAEMTKSAFLDGVK